MLLVHLTCRRRFKCRPLTITLATNHYHARYCINFVRRVMFYAACPMKHCPRCDLPLTTYSSRTREEGANQRERRGAYSIGSNEKSNEIPIWFHDMSQHSQLLIFFFLECSQYRDYLVGFLDGKVHGKLELIGTPKLSPSSFSQSIGMPSRFS